MVTVKEITEIMIEDLPECPLCGSDSGYNVTSVIKGDVKCKSCGAEWSSLDFVKLAKLERLKIKELPHGVHSYTVGRHQLRQYEEYPISFWKSLRPAEEREHGISLHAERGRVAEFLLVAAVALVVFLPGLWTFDIGWDEPVYVDAGRAYVEALFTKDFFGNVWSLNHEHPPLAKYMYGLSSLVLTPSLGDPYFGARVASSIMAALTVALTYVFASRAFNRTVGGLSAILLASTPFFYGMSRYVSLDLPITFLASASILMFYMGVEKRSVKLVLLSALFFGFAGAAKVSGFTVLLVLLIWLLLRFGNRLFSTINELRRQYPKLLLAIIIYPLIGAALFVIAWPWLWVNTFDRLFGSDGVLTYADRFRIWGHEEFFEGTVVWHPPPYYYLYYLAVKIPLPTLLFFVLGVALLLNSRMRRQSGQALLLTALWFAVPLALQTYQQPYDALRPILVIFPSMAIFSALGAERTASWVVQKVRGEEKMNSGNERTRSRVSLSSAVRFVIFATLILSSVIATLAVRPLEISYFNEFAGDSAKILNTFESSFWADGLGEAVAYVNRYASPGASVSVLGETAAFDEFHRSDLRILGYVSPSDLASSGVEYVVFQGFYLQHFVWENRTAWGQTSSGLDLWEYVQSSGSLAYVVKAGNAPLVWILKLSS